MTIRLLQGHVLDVLRSLPADSVQGVATSPPYFQLRAYGTEPQVWGGDSTHVHEWRVVVLEKSDAAIAQGPNSTIRQSHVEPKVVERADCACGAWRGELGQEPTPELFVSHIVEVFREVRRVLRPDGALLLNIGDSYNNRKVSRPSSHQAGLGFTNESITTSWRDHAANGRAHLSIENGDLKEKDLYGIPWMVAFALRADGWWLRGDNIWGKPNPMPESVQDRCTRSHEYVFHLTKRSRYFWNADALREAGEPYRVKTPDGWDTGEGGHGSFHRNGREKGVTTNEIRSGANKRSVWTIPTHPFPEAHYATFPPELAEVMVKATTREGDWVLDPFGGSGTVGLVADRLNRNAILIELKPENVAMARDRITRDSPLFVNLEMAS